MPTNDPFNIQSQWGANWFPGISDTTSGTMPPLQGASSPFLPRIAGPTTTDPGGGSGGGSSTPNLGGVVGAAVPLLMSLFGPSNQPAANAQTNTNQLQQMAQTLFGQGKDLSSAGMGALAPVLHYLTMVAGGDPNALLQATAPQRSMLIDQYDTAKKNIATFAPRGGGVTSGMVDLENKKATGLATQAADARTSGVNALGTLGTTLSGQGAQTEAAANVDMNAVIQQEEQQDARQDNLMASLGASLGKFAVAALPYLMAA